MLQQQTKAMGINNPKDNSDDKNNEDIDIWHTQCDTYLALNNISSYQIWFFFPFEVWHPDEDSQSKAKWTCQHTSEIMDLLE